MHSRTLVVMRHAKAEELVNDDHGRALTARGRRDATEAGVWLSARGLVPDHALVSSAARTVATWEAVATGARCGAAAEYADALYTATPETALEVLRGAPAQAQVLAYVGHNPTTAYVSHLLDDGAPDEAAYRRMREGYPTAAVTVLEVPGPWSSLAEGGAKICAFHVGAGARSLRV